MFPFVEGAGLDYTHRVRGPELNVLNLALFGADFISHWKLITISHEHCVKFVDVVLL